MPTHTMPASWQLAQAPLTPPVRPLWIITPVGAGVAKPVPGTLRVADAGIKPVGTEPKWQLSQVVEDGMCDVGPGGEVGGMATKLLMPAKLAGVPEATWQLAQPLVMPLWFIKLPLKRALLPTGRVLMLEPGPTWQTSHVAVVGMWLLGRPTIEKLAPGMANEGAAAPWHCAQLLVVLGALAWMLARVGITA
jgi:hypothetical protein